MTCYDCYDCYDLLLRSEDWRPICIAHRLRCLMRETVAVLCCCAAGPSGSAVSQGVGTRQNLQWQLCHEAVSVWRSAVYGCVWLGWVPAMLVGCCGHEAKAVTTAAIRRAFLASWLHIFDWGELWHTQKALDFGVWWPNEHILLAHWLDSFTCFLCQFYVFVAGHWCSFGVGIFLVPTWQMTNAVYFFLHNVIWYTAQYDIVWLEQHK